MNRKDRQCCKASEAVEETESAAESVYCTDAAEHPSCARTEGGLTESVGPYTEGEARFRLKVAENGIEKSLLFRTLEEGGRVEGGSAAKVCQGNAEDRRRGAI